MKHDKHAHDPHDPAAKPKSLTQQKADFTAEGAHPPGQVDSSIPVEEDIAATEEAHAAHDKHGKHEHTKSRKGS